MLVPGLLNAVMALGFLYHCLSDALDSTVIGWQFLVSFLYFSLLCFPFRKDLEHTALALEFSVAVGSAQTY